MIIIVINGAKKIGASATAVDFISCRTGLRMRLADAARWVSVERESECGGRA